MDIKKAIFSVLGVGGSIMVGALLKKGFSKSTADIITGEANEIAQKIVDKDMLVLGINSILNWCQILSNGRTYTCPTKKIDGKLFFRFKNEWHSVIKYVSEHADDLVNEDGKVFSRPFKE